MGRDRRELLADFVHQVRGRKLVTNSPAAGLQRPGYLFRAGLYSILGGLALRLLGRAALPQHRQQPPAPSHRVHTRLHSQSPLRVFRQPALLPGTRVEKRRRVRVRRPHFQLESPAVPTGLSPAVARPLCARLPSKELVAQPLRVDLRYLDELGLAQGFGFGVQRLADVSCALQVPG